MASDPTSEDHIPEAKEDSSSTARRQLILAALLLLALLALLYWVWARTAIVPNVTGMKKVDARRVIVTAGFKVGDEREVTAEHVQPGRVAVQNPPAGKRMFRGAAIDLAIALGLEPEPVKGGPDDEAFELPPARTSGDEYLGDGKWPNPVASKVPSVQGKRQKAAVDTLKRAGYSVVVKRGPSTTTITKGRVYFQDPAPYSRAKKTTPVVIWVSTGSPAPGTGDRYPQPEPRTKYGP